MVMSHISRMLRPRRFCDVVGQKVAVDLVKSALVKDMMMPVCSIFGPSGTGKTTLARLIALWQCCSSKINDEPCGECQNCSMILSDSHPDVFELDGGTYNSVEDIKSMLESSNYAASSYNQSGKKVYILDEVHMLSRHAMTALLKRFEEPANGLQFILATTNVEKLPETILSRSFQVRLESVDSETVAEYIDHVSHQNGYKIDKESISCITYASHGSIRQALSLLEQITILCSGNISQDRTRSMLGIASHDLIEDIILAFESKNITRLFDMTKKVKDIQPMMIVKQLLSQIQSKIKAGNASNLLIQIGYDLADASIVMHRSPYSENLLEICLGNALLKNAPNVETTKLSDIARQIFEV